MAADTKTKDNGAGTPDQMTRPAPADDTAALRATLTQYERLVQEQQRQIRALTLTLADYRDSLDMMQGQHA